MPTVVAKRNARERTRVHTVNQAFLILKQHLPSLRQFTKRVSKLRILNAAINYIEALIKLIESTEPAPIIPKKTEFSAPILSADISLVDYRTSLTTSCPQLPTVPTVFATPQPTLPYMKSILDYPAYLYPNSDNQQYQPQLIINNQIVQMPTYHCI